MEEQKELIKELKKEFEKTKKELGFKAEYDEIESCFYLEDSILDQGYISTRFSRQLCGRIISGITSWINTFHELIVPNAQNLISVNESKLFSKDERNDMFVYIKKIMALARMHNLIEISKDKKLEAEFIDECVRFWKEDFEPEMEKILKRINNGWRKENTA